MGETTPRVTGPGDAMRGDFLLVAGHGQLRTQILDKDELLIGRDPACDIVIDHVMLSRRHAVLRLGPPMTLQDLGSTNGVRVSGETMRGGAPIVLAPGETFHIGGFSFNLVARTQTYTRDSTDVAPDRLRVDDPTPAGVPAFVREVAASSTSVLIQGESGVGKDVLAATLHALSGRTGELARINCAALAEPLIESELFGYDKGAFTGAIGTKVGLLESVQGGTVFLDEIGELSLGTQAKLLRAIESREIVRLGSTTPIAIDVRFIAATHRDLPAEIAAKRFRQDLYFRLDGITLVIPPLRERKDLLSSLARGFLRAVKPEARFATGTLEALHAHDWPGNVRELKAVIERGVLLARGGDLGPAHLAFSPRVDHAPRPRPPSITPEAEPAGEDERALAHLTPEEHAQRRELLAALAQCDGNQTRAAKLLGISRTTMVNRLRLFRISRPRT